MVKRVRRESIALVICLLAVSYFVGNPAAFGLTGISYWLLYAARALIWLMIGGLVLYYPRGRAEGLYRLRGLVTGLSFFFSLFHILIYLLVGIFTSLGKTPYSRSFSGIALNLLEMSAVLFGCELSRAFLLHNLPKKHSPVLPVLISVMMALFRIPLTRILSLSGGLKLMDFLTEIAFPQLMQSWVATSLASLAGPAPAMIYLGMIRAFEYVSPYLPTPDWMPLLLFNLLVPALSLAVLRVFYIKEALMKERARESGGSAGLIVTSAVSVAVIWFAVGLFPIFPSVILTGSMEKAIMPGDVILVRKVDAESIRVGDIILFDGGDKLPIAHRVIEITEDETGRQFITKGDNNISKDSEPCHETRLRGKVVSVVPKIGVPVLYIRGGGRDAPITYDTGP